MKFLILIFLCLLSLQCGEKGTFVNDGDDCDGYIEPASSPYILPFSSGRTYEVTQGNCGQVTHVGQIRFAYDFDIQNGEQIIASRGGTVYEIEVSKPDSGGSGWFETNYIYILHDDGTMAAYVHLQENGALVIQGATVNQGDPIALSGNSGTETPHLHFQVYSRVDSWRTLPITFSNVPTERNGLIEGQSYTAP